MVMTLALTEVPIIVNSLISSKCLISAIPDIQPQCFFYLFVLDLIDLISFYSEKRFIQNLNLKDRICERLTKVHVYVIAATACLTNLSLW